MVSGVEKFKDALGAFADNYVVIGGTACDVVLSEYAVRPRATVDIDLIVVVENLSRDFVDAFWAFVREGEYHIGKRQRRAVRISCRAYSCRRGAIQSFGHHYG